MSYYDDMMDRFFSDHIKHVMLLDKFQQYARTGRNSIWTCRDGSKVRIGDMTRKHLENTIKMLETKDPTHEALSYLRFELRYRNEYNDLLKAVKHEEEIIEVL